MAMTRVVTEMGMGVDIRGRDYTQAARRAVSDAIRHSSLNVAEALGKTRDDMRISVVIGAPEPDQVDREAVARELPYGQITVTCEKGGLEIPTPDGGDAIVIANAAVLVHFDLP